MEPIKNDIGVQVFFPEYDPDWEKASNDEKRWRIIIAKKYFGLSFQKISAVFHCDPSNAAKVYKKYNINEHHTEDMRKYNPGRPSKMSKKEAEDLKLTIEQNRMITIPQMSQSMQISNRSITTKLHELGYKKVKPLNRPGLTPDAILSAP